MSLLKIAVYLLVLQGTLSSLVPGFTNQELVEISKSVASSQCAALIQKIVKALANKDYKVLEAYLPILMNTGLNWNDQGHFNACEQDPTSAYYIMKTKRTDLEIKFATGVCLPKECSVDDLNEIVSSKAI